ncbi:hypothetical protein MMC08_004240 [Hypocenomyce scalaris]|nr:hypothetical protein [Hypocenomyce scalaris]
MASPLPPDPYLTLNVPKDATLALIKSVYRKLVLTCHPDKVQDEALRAQKTHQFTQVQQAYEILSDEQRRRRYDEQVKLAELRAETLRSGARVVPEFAGPRNGVFEMRGDRMYEERAPRQAYDSDDVSPFEEPRVRRSNYDNPTSRRSSGRVYDEKRRVREVEVERERERERERRSKEAQRSSHSDRRRTRDKDRRRDYDEKHTGRRVYVEDDSGSDSESTARYSSVRRDSYSRKTYEDVRREEREDTPRRSGRREVTDHVDGYEVKIQGAQDYISKSKAAHVPEVSARRPIYRTVSAAPQAPQPQPPPPPPPPPIDTGRRSSGGRTRVTRDSSRTRSGKAGRSPEVVESPSKYDMPTRRPSMPVASSDPINLKIPNAQRREPVRSATAQSPVYSQQEPKMPLRRSETSPLVGASSRRLDTLPAKSSKLKNSDTQDSGYSSLSGPSTPEMQQSAKYIVDISDEDQDHFKGPQHSTKYKVVVNEEDEARFRGHRIYRVAPEDATSTLPRRASERPSVATHVSSSSVRGPPARSQSYAYSGDSHSSPRQPPPLSRTESSRPSFKYRPTARAPPLYGELITEEPLPYKVQHESPKIRAQDARYSSDHRVSGGSPRDAYAYAELRRPGMERRSESVCS